MSVSLTAGQRQTLFEVVLLVRYLPVSRILNHQRPVMAGQVPVFSGGRYSLLSPAYKEMAMAICLPLFRQAMPLALAFAFPKAGSSMAARIAMMAMTTSSSIRVNAARAG